MKIKKILSVLGLCMGISVGASAAAFDISEKIPQDWTVYELDAVIEHAQVGAENGIRIKCSSSGATSMAALTTSTIDLSGDMTLSFRMALSDDGGNSVRILYLNDAVPVISVSGTTVTVLDIGSFEVEADKIFDLDISYDSDSKKVIAWLDGSIAVSGTTLSVGKYNTAKSTLTISAYIMGAAAESDWFISRICGLSGYAPKAECFPAQGEAVMAEELSAAYVDFSAVTNYGTANGGTVTLYKNGSRIPCGVQRDETKITVMPEEGFVNGNKYRVVMMGGTDVFGNAADEIDYEFMTVEDGYILPQAVIKSPESGKKLVAGEEVNIITEITAGSKEIAKAELVEDGTVIKEVTDAPYIFTYSGKVGKHTLKVIVYDIIGAAAESNEIALSITENVAPTVSIIGVPNGGEVLMNNGLTVSANDENGNLDRILAYIDGEQLVQTDEFKFEYPRDLPLGKHMLTVYAYDTAGASAKASATAYFTKADVETEINQDMSGYKSERKDAAFPAGMMGEISSGFVCAGERGGIHGMVLGVNENLSGKSAYAGISWLGTSDMPKEQFTCEMDIWFDNIKSGMQSVIRSNEATTRFSQQDIIFREGVLTLYDGGFAAKTVPYQAERWYTLRMEVNLLKGTYSCYFDGELVADNYALAIAVPDISVLRFHYTSRTNEENAMCMSRFVVNDITSYPYLCSTDIGDGKMPLDTKVITAYMNVETAEQFVIEKAEIFADGYTADAASYSYDAATSSVSVEMAEYPSAGENYTLLVTGRYMGNDMKTLISVTAETGSFDAENTGFVSSENSVRFYADMRNESAETAVATAVIIKYENGIMTDIASTTAEVGAGGARITTPTVNTDGQEVSIIAVIWDDWNSRMPINNLIYTYEQ